MSNKHVKLKYEKERVLKLLTNEMTDLKKMTLKMIVQAADYDELGYMDGRDPTTGEIVPLLVGLEPNGAGSFTIYPIARFYLGSEIPEFEPPDGRGNYIAKSADGTHRADGSEPSNERVDESDLLNGTDVLGDAVSAYQEEGGEAERLN